jgi:hypothetical protein
MQDKKDEFVKAPKRSLPLTGVPVAGIRGYAELPCRAAAERDLLNFIKACLNAERIYACVIKAWWGEGKTDAYENFIKPELEKIGGELKDKKIFTFDVVATTVARIFEEIEKRERVLWRPFLASIFEAVWEEKKSNPDVKVFERINNEIKSDDYIKRVINQLGKENKIFFFIDELEQLERFAVSENMLLGIRGLIDQKEEILRGNIHLIMACTPDAFNRLIRLSTQMGGLLDRLTVIELPRPSKEEAVKFVYGLINYMYEGEPPDPHPFLNSGVAYAIAYAAHGSPRSMIKVLQQVIEYAKYQAREKGYEGYLKRIDGWTIIDALKNYNISIFGSQVPALDGDFLDYKILNILNIKGEPNKTNLLKKLICLLIGEPIPISLSELSIRLNASEYQIKECIGIANNRVEESKVLNGLLILKLSKSSKPREKIPEDLRRYFLLYLISDNSNELKLVPFIAQKDREARIFRSLFPSLDLMDAQKISMKISEYASNETYYLISPELIDHIYPNPEFLELEFIKDKNKRLELWKNAYEKINYEQYLSLCEETLKELIQNLSSTVE